MNIKTILFLAALSISVGIFLSISDKRSGPKTSIEIGAKNTEENFPTPVEESSINIQISEKSLTAALSHGDSDRRGKSLNETQNEHIIPHAVRSTVRAPKWNFDRAPFHPSDIQHWIGTREKPLPGVAQVKFYDGHEGLVFLSGDKGEAPITLNLMNPAGLAKIQEDRLQLSAASQVATNTPTQPQNIAPDKKTPEKESSSNPSDPSLFNNNNGNMSSNAFSNTVTTPTAPTSKSLDAHAFEVVAFHPGLMNDRKTRIAAPSDLNFAIQGPDFSFKYIAKEKLTEEGSSVKSNLISLGHEGELILRVKNGGWIQDEAGADFTIYENVFKVSKDLYFQEFARVGVAEEDRAGAYHWFQCDPSKNSYAGCAGVIPTATGGDAFDLSWIGVSRIKYIKIVDRGNNAHVSKTADGFGYDSTEGFDFDSMLMHHAYSLP